MTHLHCWRIIIITIMVSAVCGCLRETVLAQNANDAALIRNIENNLIAPCCWNQPISEHPSEVSDRMRAEVRMMVAQGKSRDEILDYYVAEYGERILATPRARGINTLAYIAPWAVLILGGWGLFTLLGRRRVAIAADNVSADDTAIALPADYSGDHPSYHYADIIEKELREMDE